MKKNLILILAFISFFGCDEYLDELPDNRQSITTLEDISELLVSAYSGGTYNFVEFRTDNAVAILDNAQLDWMTENFQYVRIVSSEAQDTPTWLWENNYEAIAHANQALAGLEDVKGGDTSFRNALKGEALLARAYNHFILANVFCQHYTSSNTSSLGIPYITAPETNLKVEYDRGTLEDTYNNIEKDLLEGLPLISDEYYVGSTKYHFNKNAAYAFASRFYLFKEDYAKCIEYSNKLLGSGLVNSVYVRNMNEVFTGTFDVRAANFIDINSPTNLLVVRKDSFINRENRGYRATINKHGEVFFAPVQSAQDFRYSPYTAGTDAAFQPKYDELFEFTTATTGFGYFIMPELRSEEVVLNRMESYVRLNRLDDALNDYNAIAPMWYNGGELTQAEITAFFGGTEQEAMLSFILSERRKEFINEGLRWFDIKRFNLEVSHTDVNGDEFLLSSQDLKKAVQIPEKGLANGIEPNPR